MTFFKPIDFSGAVSEGVVEKVIIIIHSRKNSFLDFIKKLLMKILKVLNI